MVSRGQNSDTQAEWRTDAEVWVRVQLPKGIVIDDGGRTNLSLIANIRPEERRTTGGAFLALFLIMAGHILLETARDALFLSRLPASQLPWTYLGIAAVALVLFALERSRGRGSPTRTDLGLWLFGSAGVTLLFWWLTRFPMSWVLFALYIWTGVFATLIVVRFWTLIGDYFSIDQAKRIFALITMGSVLGAITGSAIARILSSWFEARELLIGASFLFVCAGCVPLALLPKLPLVEKGKEAIQAAGTFRKPLLAINQDPYLRRVGAMVLLSTVLFTLVDFLFKREVAARIPAEELGSFFASAYLLFNVLSLVSQVFLVRYLAAWIRKLKIDYFLTVLPVLLAAGSVAILAGAALMGSYLLKGIDGAFRHSLHRTSSEMLFVPLTSFQRSRVKGIIDVLGQRGGQALASVLILLASLVGLPSWGFALAVFVLALAWAGVARSLRPYYLGLFRRTLNENAIASRVEYPDLDLASLEALMRALNSADNGEVLAALDLLAEQERSDLVPALILYHPEQEVVTRALGQFVSAGRLDILPILDRLFLSDDPEIRASALRSRSWLSPDIESFDRMANDSSPIVRATAWIGQASFTGSTTALATINQGAKNGNATLRLALAKAIRYSPGALYEEALIELANSPEREVRQEVTLGMQQVLSVKFIPTLIGMLADREARAEARRTLVAIGPDALTALEATLRDPGASPKIRRHLPRSIHRFRNQRAVEILIGCLIVEEDDVVSYKALRALGAMRRDLPELDYDREVLSRAARNELTMAFRQLDRRFELERGGKEDESRLTLLHELVRDFLAQNEETAKERLFRILGILHPEEEVYAIFRGLTSSRRDKRASARELIENLLEPSLRDPLLRLIDETSADEKLRGAVPFYIREPRSYDHVLGVLLEEGGMAMRCLVVGQIGELGLSHLSDRLRALVSDPDGHVQDAVERSLTQMGLTLPGPLGTSDPGLSV